MCGRYVAAASAEEIAEYFDAAAPDEPLEPRYNVAPTLDVPVVVEGGAADGAPSRRIEVYRWGLVPGWAKDMGIGARLVNARSETAATNNSFKSSMSRRRCIVPADGFYEWDRPPAGSPKGAKKQPYYYHRHDGLLLAFAGLWAEWHGEVAGEQVVLRSTTILTTSANATLSPVHDRMPVILPRRGWDRWLDPGLTDPRDVADLLRPAPDDLLDVHPVSTEVNNARHEGAQLVDPVDLSAPAGAGAADGSGGGASGASDDQPTLW